MKLNTRFVLCVVFAGLLAVGVAAQTKKNNQPQIAAPEPTPAKRNERPGSDNASRADIKDQAGSLKTQSASTYFYEFTRPGFTYERILIEHSDDGKGTISFLKDGQDEVITDPVTLSPRTVAKINEALTELTFLDSTEDYQYPTRDFSHMGNVSFKLKRDGRSRTVKFNWTENKAAKVLMDEYRRISNEYTWKFEILLARQNLPLQTPGLMDMLVSFLKRGEISDSSHLLPFLTELSNDERLPLMARNRAAKLVKEIEKQK